MELVGPAHGANQTNVVVLSIFGNGELGRDGVDGVDDVVELAVRLLQNAREELVDVVAQQVFGAFDNGGGGIDIADHGIHHVHFALADGAVKGDGLAIDIAGRDDVLVQNDEMTDAPRASASQQLEPTPPQPSTSTVAAASLSSASRPMMISSLVSRVSTRAAAVSAIDILRLGSESCFSYRHYR